MEIGNIVIEYDIEGNLKSAQFVAATNLEIPEALKEGIKGGKEPEAIEANAKSLFASWFASMVNVELADKGEIKTHIEECVKYPNGMVHFCTIKFSFE